MRKLGIAVLTIALIALTTSAFADSGADLYKAKCAMCHGPDGSGSTPMGKKLNVQDLRSPDVTKQTDAELSATISKGKNKMPAYADKLTAAQIHEVVEYVRDLAKKK
jgi:cytochrome c6